MHIVRIKNIRAGRVIFFFNWSIILPYMVFLSSIHLIFISGSGQGRDSRVSKLRMFRMEGAPETLPQIMVNLGPDGGTRQGRRRGLTRRLDDGNSTHIRWRNGCIFRKPAAIKQEGCDGRQHNLEHPGFESFCHGLKVPD